MYNSIITIYIITIILWCNMYKNIITTVLFICLSLSNITLLFIWLYPRSHAGARKGGVFECKQGVAETDDCSRARGWCYFGRVWGHLLDGDIIHTYMRACIRTYVRPYIYTYMHACMHACMHTCIHAYMHTCIYIHTCIHAYMHTCIHAYMHTCIRAYMRTCIHACIRTSIHT